MKNTDKAEQQTGLGNASSVSDEAREHAKLLLEMKHISHSKKDVEILAQDLELVQSEFQDESSVMEASAILRERIGGWNNLMSYMNCIRIGK